METNMVSVGLFVQTGLLGAALVLGQFLDRKKIRWFGDAAAALGLGVLIGLIAKLAGAAADMLDVLAFKGDFFILALLPPIMFDAGFSLDFDLFMAHLLPISLFAFIGTTASMLLVGVTMWGAGVWGLIHALSPLKAMLFGAIISATDPVTVLAVFKKLGARDDLYITVFGESVLNDAVGIVLYETIAHFLDGNDPVNATSVFTGIGLFIGIFTASMVLGIVVGFLCSTVLATGIFRHPEGPAEPGFLVMAALVSYFAAQGAGLSGIVAIIFCGITINRAAKPHLNHSSLHHMESFFHVTANLAELFVFIYIGTMLFIDTQEWHIWAFLGVALFALAHSRALQIVPLSACVNLTRPKAQRIPKEQQFMLWWSGLRGGVAFALSVNAAHDYGKDGKFMETATFLICALTVVINGGASPWIMQRLQLLRSQQTDSMDIPPTGHKLAKASRRLVTKYPNLGPILDRLSAVVGLQGRPADASDSSASSDSKHGSGDGKVATAKIASIEDPSDVVAQP